jgi:serine/threonine-protein kinase HipA
MTSKKKVVFAFIFLRGQRVAVPAAKLTLVQDGATLLQSQAEYGKSYVARADAIALDPVDLPLPNPAAFFPVTPGRGLHEFGAIRDAAPDAWGRRVIENRLKRAGPLPESDYLLHAGPGRVGALDFRLKASAVEAEVQPARRLHLAYLAEAARRVDAGESVPAALQDYLAPGGSMGGARPKAVVYDNGRCWLAKFPAQGDRFDVQAVEAATLRLASAAGLDVPEVQCEKLDAGTTAMLIARFDREQTQAGETRRHFISALTLTGKHESESHDASYVDIVEALRRYGDPSRIRTDCRELFGRMVFNILVSNDDDHLRNHGFLWHGKGYGLSPLYDVVPRPNLQKAQERYIHLSVGTQGRLATLPNAMTKHAAFELTRAQATETIERIASVVRAWKNHFEQSNVAARDIDAVASGFRNPRDVGLEHI